jgi:NADH dehydrogenase
MATLVVGATGLLGTEICRRLAKKGTPLRALARESSDPARVEAVRELGAEVVLGDLRDRGSLDRACAGVEVVYSSATSILREAEISAVDRAGQLDLVDAARGAGVRRFVYVSFEDFGPETSLEEAKRAVEQRLRTCGITYTILQPGLFHESWLGPATGFDAAAGTVNVYGAGDAKLPWVALGDVATAAANVLDEPETENAVVPLAAERLSYREAIAIFEQVTGRPLTVREVSAEALAAQRAAASNERDESFAGLMLWIATGASSGDGETWLGRLGVARPTTVRDVAARYVRP